MSSERPEREYLRCGAWLTMVVVIVAGLLAGPAYLLQGWLALEGLCYAAILCLIPGWVVFLAVAWYGDSVAPVWVILSGTVVRMVFVLVGALVVLGLHANLGFQEFLVWLLAFYLVALFVETWLLLKQLPD